MSIQGDVLRIFEGKPGQNVHVKDLADELSLTTKQVQNAVSQLRWTKRANIVNVVSGAVWKLESAEHENRETEMIVEILSQRGDALLVRTEDGGIFKMIPLDF